MVSAEERRRLLIVSVIGIALFAAGLLIARARLPEWRTGEIPRRSFFVAQLNDAASRAGLQLRGVPRIRLNSVGTVEEELTLFEQEPAYEIFGTAAPDWLAAEGRGPFVETVSEAAWSDASPDSNQLEVVFSLRGEPLSASWKLSSAPFLERPQAGEEKDQRETVARILVPSASLSGAERLEILGVEVFLLPVGSAGTPESLLVSSIAGVGQAFAERSLGSLKYLRDELESIDLGTILLARLPELVPGAILFLSASALFLLLLARRRIDLTNGAIFATLTFLLSLGELSRYLDDWLMLLDKGGDALARSLAVLVLWSAAESWIRSTVPGFRTSLDLMRSGRIGPRGGQTLLSGWAMGAALAGLWLIASVASTYFPGLSPTGSSVELPIFGAGSSPFGDGAIRAGVILLVMSAALQLPLIRRIPFAATIAGAWLLSPWLEFSAFWFSFAVALVIAGVMVYTHTRFGLSALLVGSIVSLALPAFVYSAAHLEWLGGSLAATGALVAAPLFAGVAGLRRSEEPEVTQVSVPAFVRRLEEERRLKYEMDLLARMQLGLLPRETPRLEGYEIAAQSVLATEAGGDLYDFLSDQSGRLWIAAGDVSGHGYSCAIAQAMTKAGLASLVGPDQTPAAVLERLDRVLRGSGSVRTFTTLVLLRLDPARGEGLVANAGHPYPLIVADGMVSELAMPSLPLGQGPARSYQDRAVELQPGNVIAFYSDGLFEALNGQGSPYGFDRLRELLRESVRFSADQILERILADWRRHATRAAPVDDTTIVIVKRRIA